MANTVKSLLAADPCLACLSIEELQQLQLALYAKKLSKPLPTNLATILSDSVTFKDVSEKQALIIETTKLLERFGAGETIATLRTATACLKCIDPKSIRAALLLLEAQLLDTV